MAGGGRSGGADGGEGGGYKGGGEGGGGDGRGDGGSGGGGEGASMSTSASITVVGAARSAMPAPLFTCTNHWNCICITDVVAMTWETP